MLPGLHLRLRVTLAQRSSQSSCPSRQPVFSSLSSCQLLSFQRTVLHFQKQTLLQKLLITVSAMGNSPSNTPTESSKDWDLIMNNGKSSSPHQNEGGGDGNSEVMNISGISTIGQDSPGRMSNYMDVEDADVSMGSVSSVLNKDTSCGGDDGQGEIGPCAAAAISGSTVSPRMKSKITPSISASTSFDERFKYKISIYSKVSGCRMTNLPDYTIVKQVRVVSLQYITNGDPIAVLNIKFAYEKMKNGGLQIITDDKRLSNALSGLAYFASIPCKMTFPNSPRVVGFVKDLPINLEPAELKREVRKSLPEVYSVRYITERSAGKSRPSQRPCAFVSFNLRYLPGFIRVYAKDYEILVPNPMQCTRCCRYGHQGKQCRAETRCPICGKPHAKQHCNSQIFRCVNCKGSHPSTSHECLVWQQGKLMNELRYRGGLTAEEAIDVASNGTIQHKKHSFIAPNEYFENLESFYLGSGSGDGSGEEGDVLNNNDTLNNPLMSNTSFVAEDGNNHDYYNDENVVFHPRFVAAQEFLDIMTDFFLKLTNPTKNFTSSTLMPGFEEDSVLHRLTSCRSKKPSKVAQQFKLSVLQACVEDEHRDIAIAPINA